MSSSPHGSTASPSLRTPTSEKNRPGHLRLTGDNTPTKSGSEAFTSNNVFDNEEGNYRSDRTVKILIPGNVVGDLNGVEDALVADLAVSVKTNKDHSTNHIHIQGSSFKENLVASQKQMNGSFVVTRDAIRQRQEQEVSVSFSPLNHVNARRLLQSQPTS